MPYILENQRLSIGIDDQSDLFCRLGEQLVTNPSERTHWAMGIVHYWLHATYEQNYDTSLAFQMTAPFSDCMQIASNINDLVAQGHGLDGLLNYSITRFFNEAFPAPRYKDYNDMIGILEVLKKHFSNRIDTLGMLTCCQMEYYRKYAAPYEDEKEQENGAVIRPAGKSTRY